MNDLIKKIKVKDGITNKFLSVDENGNIVSSNYGKDDIVDITNKIQTLETLSSTIGEKIIDINGEQV